MRAGAVCCSQLAARLRRLDAEANPLPLQIERFAHVGDHRPLHFEREIPARLVETHAVLIEVVDDIDAAAKRICVVDYGELAMRARKPERPEQMRVVDAMLDVRLRPTR